MPRGWDRGAREVNGETRRGRKYFSQEREVVYAQGTREGDGVEGEGGRSIRSVSEEEHPEKIPEGSRGENRGRSGTVHMSRGDASPMSGRGPVGAKMRGELWECGRFGRERGIERGTKREKRDFWISRKRTLKSYARGHTAFLRGLFLPFFFFCLSVDHSDKRGPAERGGTANRVASSSRRKR